MLILLPVGALPLSAPEQDAVIAVDRVFTTVGSRLTALPATMGRAADHSRLTRPGGEARAAATAFLAWHPMDSRGCESGLATANDIPLFDPIGRLEIGNADPAAAVIGKTDTAARAAKPDELQPAFLATPRQALPTLAVEWPSSWIRFCDGAHWETPRVKCPAATGIPAMFPRQPSGTVVDANARDDKPGATVNRLPGR